MDTLACALDFTVFQSEVFQKQSLTLLSGWNRTRFVVLDLAQGLHIYLVLFHFTFFKNSAQIKFVTLAGGKKSLKIKQ